MDYYLLDKVSWEHSQTLYHAAAYLGREALFILRPATPYICIGCHQDAKVVIDMDFAGRANIPVFRREVGGGAVYLDGDQLFYQLVIRADRPEVPSRKKTFYEKFLQPVIDTYRAFGVDAVYKPVNDIIANQRKISGNGAAEINEMVILVGNFIIDFPYEMMSKTLRVPDEKFRDKVYKTLNDNLTTMIRETGNAPSTEALGKDVIARFTHILGEGEFKTEIDDELRKKADELFAEMHTPEFLFENDRRTPDTSVKIREGVYVVRNAYKADGGLIQVTAVKIGDILKDVHISGDFFFYPAADLSELEDALQGVSAEQDVVVEAIREFYAQREIESPGVEPEDLTQALFPAR
ncbi:MAG: lipoate--protein ligase [Anaerolineales bacterium]